MKKILVYLIAATFSFGLISCGDAEEKKDDKKATTFNELHDKYDGSEFKTCEEFIEFGYEYIDLIIVKIEKALDGDEEALDKIEEIDHFMFQFSEQAEMFYDDCPELFEEFDQVAEEKMAEPMEKLMELMFGQWDDIDWDEEFEDMDWEEEYEIEEYEES